MSQAEQVVSVPATGAESPGALRPVLGVARDGWPIIAAFVVGAAGVAGLGYALIGPLWPAPAAVAAALLVWCVWFFRDPERITPDDEGIVVSPADGVVCGVGAADPPGELGLSGSGMTRISVFMNVFNVHVNRAPSRGTVERVRYRPGRFFNASFDKASDLNERCAMSMVLPDGRKLAVVQIAGLIARRIVCRVNPGRDLRAGERFGMIRFGSRVDVYLPPGVSPRVKTGERVTAGVTALASLGVR